MSFKMQDIGNGQEPREQLGVGLHIARLVGFATTGLLERDDYQGVARKPAARGFLMLELLNLADKTPEGETTPYIHTYGVNLNNSPRGNLFKAVAALDPQGLAQGDLALMVNQNLAVHLHIIERVDAKTGKVTGTCVSGLVPAPGEHAPAKSPARLYDHAAPCPETFSLLPEWMQKVIASSAGYVEQPAAVQPAAVQPAAVQSAAVQPAAVQSAAVQSAAVQPAAVQPAAVQPAAVQPAAVQPVDFDDDIPF